MKKKIFAIAMAVAMMASLSSMAFAVEVDQDNNTGTKAVTVSLTETSTYTVTIPADVTYSKTTPETNKLVFSANNVLLEKGKQLKVTADSAIDNTGKLSLALSGGDAADKITLDVKKGDVAITDSIIATFISGATASDDVTVTLSSPSAAPYAGTYTGTINFTISVEPTTT